MVAYILKHIYPICKSPRTQTQRSFECRHVTEDSATMSDPFSLLHLRCKMHFQVHLFQRKNLWSDDSSSAECSSTLMCTHLRPSSAAVHSCGTSRAGSSQTPLRSGSSPGHHSPPFWQGLQVSPPRSSSQLGLPQPRAAFQRTLGVRLLRRNAAASRSSRPS